MTQQWYYADRLRRQIGPQPTEDIARLFRGGEVDAATLLWREGMDNWQPLGSLRAELGLEEASATLDFRVEPTLGAAASVVPAATGTALPEGHPAALATGPAAATGRDSYAIRADNAGTLVTPVAAGEVIHAGLWRRFAASFLDGLVTGVAGYTLLIPLALVFGVSMASFANAGSDGAMPSAGFLVAYYAISLAVPALYFAWMHSSGTQASLGKMAVGAKVVRGNGERIGFGRALLRYLAYVLFIVLTCGLGVLISGLMVAFTQRKQAPHDMLCDTLVVDKWAFTDHPERQQAGLGTVTVVVLVLFGLLMVGVLVATLALVGLVSTMNS